MRRLATAVTGALIFLLVAGGPSAFGQTGKIAGQVTDAESGDPLPGVNVLIEGEQIGATTNADGRYSIVGVEPGTYSVRASFVGYAEQVVQGVQVNVDLTTTVNFDLQEETQELQEVTVQATQPVVKPDVSANVANIEAESFETIPVAGVTEVINLQAGIEPGLSVRGGGRDELRFAVDGMSMRTGRRNEPFTGISYTSVQQMQVQTGGFNAEYGNVRSGLINIVTKDAPRDRYMADALVRYQPPQEKRFGPLPTDPQGYWLRARTPNPDIPDDQDPAFVGSDPSNSAWDKYEARQYHSFVGWNTVANQLASDADPNNDMTAEQLVRLNEFRTRHTHEITRPDYVADVTVGGPLVPGLSGYLGDLRFLASYRQKQTAYPYVQQRDTYLSRFGQATLTTNPATGVKVNLRGMYSIETGINTNRNRGDVNMWDGEMPTYPWGWPPSIGNPSEREIFSPHVVNPVDVTHWMAGGGLTHTLGPKTFYEVSLQRMASKYESHQPRRRDFTKNAFCMGPDAEEMPPDQADPTQPGVHCFNETPYGWPAVGMNMLNGINAGGHFAKTRDSSEVALWTGNFDVTSQVTPNNQVKAGLDLQYSVYDIQWRSKNVAYAVDQNINNWEREPIQGAVYVQDKLEFQGMIANVGLRLDYLDPNARWPVLGPYSRVLGGTAETLDTVRTSPTDPQVDLSPRMGVSFPVTADSKLYFNYGHFRQMLGARAMFGVTSNTGGLSTIGNPNHPMPKTVAYEMGYDQNLFDMFLLRISGFYRDVRFQPRSVGFENLGGQAQYSTDFPWNYEDIRGVEFTLRKNRGQWLRGFANFTFTSTKSGNFGFSQFFENDFRMREYLRTSTDYTIFAPVAQPYARVNLAFLTPPGYGPEYGSISPLSNWRLNLLGNWREGNVFTWTGGAGQSPELNNNVSWRDYFMFDLRLAKQITSSVGDVELFADISNVFNIRHLSWRTAFASEGQDWQRYMRSLHLPESTFDGVETPPYLFIHGDDQPGDFRPYDIEYQPVEVVESLDRVTESTASESARAYFYSKSAEDYFQWEGGSWSAVDEGSVEEMLDKKSYIDMPNLRYAAFFHPRQVLLGVRLNF